VAQKLLHGLDVFTVCLEQSGEGVPERVPADLAGIPAAFTAGSRFARYKVRGQYGCFPSLAGLAKTQSSGFG